MTNHDGPRLDTAKHHFGIALVIAGVAKELLSTGDLVQVLAYTVGHQNHVPPGYPEREFVDFMATRVTASG
jgi:hypothetical protein